MNTILNELNIRNYINVSKKTIKALQLANKHFKNKFRNNGSNYYDDHILKVFDKIRVLGYGEEYQVVGVLHDIFEDTDVTYEYIVKEFGENIADYILILTIDKTKGSVEEFRSVKNATQNDVTKVVRFADRLSNLEQTSKESNSNDFINKMITKTLSLYIPNFDDDFKLSLELEVQRLKNEL